MLKFGFISVFLHIVWGASCVAGTDTRITNANELRVLASQGDSNALCLIGIHEFLGGQIYDPRIIHTVTVEQILLNKRGDWSLKISRLAQEDRNQTIQTGEKIQTMARYIKQSADLDNRIGLFCYGELLRRGIGLKQDFENAFAAYLKSANKGFLPAYAAVGRCYNSGKGTPFNQEKAVEWYLKGDKEGDSESTQLLGRAFLYGWGVRKDPEHGFKLIQKASDNGCIGATGDLGMCFRDGLGTKKDLGKAFLLIKQAAESDTEAMVDLGLMYLYGQQPSPDKIKGIRLLEAAADTGNAYAQRILGYAYEKGLGVPINFGKAKELYEQSAKQGYETAMIDLFAFYYYGIGDTKIDEDFALGWLNKAKELKNEGAELLLKELKESQANKSPGYIYHKAMSILHSDKSNKEKQDAVQMLEQCSKSEYGPASVRLGCLYEEGKYVSKDFKMAKELYLKVISANNQSELGAIAEAKVELGELYYFGDGVEKDYSRSYQYFLEAEQYGLPKAKACIGLCYYTGTGTSKNYSEALAKFLSAVDGLENNIFKSWVMNSIGFIYFNSGDRIEANKWWSRAIASETPEPLAFYNLGLSFFNGEGVDKNKDKALELLRKGAAKGNKNSINALAKIEAGQTP